MSTYTITAEDADWLNHVAGGHGRLRRNLNLHENLVMTLYEQVLTEGDVAIDGGAHRAWHTVPMAKLVGSSGEIWAFEPTPRLVSEIRAALSQQGLYQVKLIDKALAEVDGKASFQFLPKSDGLSGLKLRPGIGPEVMEAVSPIEVDTVALDSIIPRHLRPKFIKLDLEGGEMAAMRGARRILTEARPIIAFEHARWLCEFYGYTEQEFFDFFDGINYRLYDTFGRDFRELAERNDISLPWQAIAAPADDENAMRIMDDFPRMAMEVGKEMVER